MFQFLSKYKFIRFCALSALLVVGIYIAGRVYYQVTGGFVLSNIMYDVPYDSRWDMSPLSESKKIELDTILSQPFRYLGKGCQAYVFESDDKQYVIKFFKYQRFKPQQWLTLFSFIPTVEKYRQEKIEKKKHLLNNVFTSWKIAYESIPENTGVVYVHLNKGNVFNNELTIYDKIGLQHSVNLNATEFLVQKKADLLCSTLEGLHKQGDDITAQRIVSELVDILLLEYARGFADNDHALMQNTGVLNEKPIHIDVGQFVYNPIVKDPNVYHQEIFNKTYRFRKWLEKQNPSLAQSLDAKLESVIGNDFWSMTPFFYTADMARIPNVAQDTPKRHK